MKQIYNHFADPEYKQNEIISIEHVLTEEAIKQAKYYELGLNFANRVYSGEKGVISIE